MSRWLVLLGLVCGFGISCMAMVWFLTRELPTPERVVSPPRAARVARSPQAAPATAGQAPLPTSYPAAGYSAVGAAPGPQAVAGPLLEGGARPEPAATAAFESQAQLAGSGEPAAQAELSVGVYPLPAGTGERQPGSEAGAVVHEIALGSRGPGQSAADAGSRELRADPAASVVAAAGEAADGRDNLRGRGRRLSDEGRMWR